MLSVDEVDDTFAFEPTEYHRVTLGRRDHSWVGSRAVFDPNLMLKVTKIGLHPFLVRQLHDQLGIKRLFPVQSSVLPLALSNNRRDICVSAPTGQGKTLCYALPILDAILKSHITPSLRAIVVAPTRELVRQILSVFQSLSTDIHCRAFHGEAAWTSEVAGLEFEPLEVMIATPGRLVEHYCRSVKQATVYNWSSVEFFVLDEVDALFSGDAEFIRVVEGIRQVQREQKTFHVVDDKTSAVPLPRYRSLQPRENLRLMLFSATLSRDPTIYKQCGLNNPHFILADASGSYVTPDTLHQTCVTCTGRTTGSDQQIEKLRVLWSLIQEEARNGRPRVAVFCRSKDTVSAVAAALQQLIKSDGIGLVCQEFSAAFLQHRRLEVVNGFREGRVHIIVASDVAARGLDVVDLGVVVNFSVPLSLEAYVHRAGRTARAGRQGQAYTLVTPDETEAFAALFEDAEGLDFDGITQKESSAFSGDLRGVSM